MQAQQRQGMRRAVIGLGVATTVLVSGCAADDPNRRAKTGAAIGALVGAVAGHQVDGDKGRYVGAAVGALAGLTGSYVSYTEPNMPTGPWIVMCLSVLALGSLFLAPKNGALGKILRQRQNRKKIISENLLKVFYHLEERNTEGQIFNKVNINGLRYFKEDELKKALDILRKNYWIIPKSGGYQLSAKGRDEAMRVVRFHRLWELYLIKRMGMKADHIHPNAETMEHIITPEIEGELLAELDYPEKDPHHSPIPYKK